MLVVARTSAARTGKASKEGFLPTRSPNAVSAPPAKRVTPK